MASILPFLRAMMKVSSGRLRNLGCSAISSLTRCLASPCSFVATASYQPTSRSSILEEYENQMLLYPKVILYNPLVNEERGLSVASVALVESATRFYEHVIEVVGHLGLGIAVDEPHQLGVVILDAVANVLFAQQESKLKKALGTTKHRYTPILTEEPVPGRHVEASRCQSPWGSMARFLA